VTGAAFFNGQAEHALRRFTARRYTPEMIILHGMHLPFGNECMKRVSAMHPRTVVLISPSIRSLGIDADHLRALGWKPATISLFDQIPHTRSLLGMIQMI
jgi:hypothetical protein